jgi:hypothetical protein
MSPRTEIRAPGLYVRFSSWMVNIATPLVCPVSRLDQNDGSVCIET